MRLAGGERQVLWLDEALRPRLALRLRLEEDDCRPKSGRVRTLLCTLR